MTTRTMKLAVGTTTQCRPTFLDQNSRPMYPVPTGTTYTSSTPTIATIDTNGRLTAVAAGTTVITATNGSLTATLNVTVYTPALTAMTM